MIETPPGQKAKLAGILRKLVPLFVVVSSFALLAWWLDDKRLTLDYLKALAWPAVVASLLWWIREPLRAKIADLLEVSGMGVTGKFAEANRELESDIAVASSVLVSDDAPADPEPDQQPDPEPQTDAETQPSLDGHMVVTPGQAEPGSAEPVDDGPVLAALVEARLMRQSREREEARRAAMETVIRESAGWGYDMGKLGFQGRPVPVIEWDASGQPRIQYARGETPDELAKQAKQHRNSVGALTLPASVADRREHVTKLEDEIKRLERAADGNPVLRIAGTTESELRRARERLRRLDPSNPYLR